MKSDSYRHAECCHAADCDLLGENPDEPCWGQVEMDSPGDDEDGWPIPGHLCQGHRDRYNYWDEDKKDYYPEPVASLGGSQN